MRAVLTLFVLLIISASCSPKREEPPAFDAGFAMETLIKLTRFGDRPAGSENNFKQAEFIAETAAEYDAKIEKQKFTCLTPEGNKPMINVIAEVKGRKAGFIVVGCHFDSKKFNSQSGFTAANDGASGAALLITCIKAFKESGKTPLYSLRFVFFDGEECLFSYTENDGLHGSRHYVNSLEQSGELKNCKAAIVVDMIGDKDLVLTLSRDTAPDIAEKLFSSARACGMGKHVSWSRDSILDDHVPFLKKGIPAIDLIDFDFGPGNSFWHSPGDNISNVSADSLNAAGMILLSLISEISSAGN